MADSASDWEVVSPEAKPQAASQDDWETVSDAHTPPPRSEPDMSHMKGFFETNFKKATEVPADPAKPKPHEAASFLEAIEAGWQMSTAPFLPGTLFTRGKMPDVEVSENAGMAYRIAAGAATMAGDIPMMLAGGAFGAMGGGAVGTAVLPGPGTAVGTFVGGAGGTFAAPTAVRDMLMQHYEKGDIHDFGDFWERTSSVLADTAKSFGIGVATAGAGKVAGVLTPALKALSPASNTILKGASVTTSEITAMVAVGKALEGEMPTRYDFAEAAILVAGLHGVSHGLPKLTEIYRGTGIKPEEVALESQVNPALKEQLLNLNEGVPKTYEGQIDPNIKQQEAMDAAELAKKAETPPAPESKAPDGSERPDSEKNVLARMGAKASEAIPETVKDKAIELKDQAIVKGKEFYKDRVDRTSPIGNAMTELGFNPDKVASMFNPQHLARMSGDFTSKTIHAIRAGSDGSGGMIDFKTQENVTRPLETILKDVPDQAGLKAYMLSARVVELAEQGRDIKTGISLEDAKDVVQRGKKEYGSVHKELVDFANAGAKYARDAGVISSKDYNAIVEAGKSFTSLKRVMEPGDPTGKGKKALQSLKGSERQIQDPILSLVQNTEHFFKVAERNRARIELVKMAESIDGQDVMEKVTTKLKPIEVKADEVSRALKEQGIQGDPEAFDIFRPVQDQLSKGEFEVRRDGKREVWKTKDPALAESLVGLDGNPAAQSLLFKLARGVTQMVKFGTTIMPDFKMRNAIRDNSTRGVFSKGDAGVLDVLVAMGDLFHENEHYFNMLKSGGGGGGSFTELNEKYLNKHIYKLNEETGDWISKARNYISEGGRIIDILSGEQANRLAEHKNVRAKQIAAGKSEAQANIEGGFAARQVTVDFERMGAKMSAWNAITAFLNPSIQGLDRTVQAMREAPVQTTIQSVARLTVPSVLLWAAVKDDERYKNAPQWQKDLFWIFPIDHWVSAGPDDNIGSMPESMVRQGPNGTVEINTGPTLRIPKPQELGIMFATLPERVLEKFLTDNPRAMKNFEETIFNALTPSLMPNIASPIVEQYMNKSLFTGQNLVPHHLEGLLPDLQYTEYTTETGKILGKMIGAIPGVRSIGPDNAKLESPIVAENFVRAYGGTLGIYLLQAIDKSLEKSGLTPEVVRPKDTLADIPFVKAFAVRYPSAGAQPIQDFYDAFEHADKVYNSIRSEFKNQDFTGGEKRFLDNQDMLRLSGIKAALVTQGMVVRDVNKDTSMTPVEKRQFIDGVYYQMIETAKMGNQIMDEYKKQIKGN